MKAKKVFIVSGITVAIICAAWYGWQMLNAPVYNSKKTVSYSFNLSNTTNRVLEEVEFWTYAPVKETATQLCCERLQTSHPFIMETDETGNQVMHFSFKNMPPFGVKVIRITADLQMASKPNWRFSFKPTSLLQKEPLIESDHKEIKMLAASLLMDESLKTANKIYDWVVGNVKDSGYLQEERGALYALRNKSGDCTESAYLFTALARANDIPSRAVAGYFVKDNGLLRAEAYHEWAEFFVAGVWYFADPQKRVYDSHYEDYIAMRRVDNREDSRFKFARYKHSGNGLKVTMN